MLAVSTDRFAESPATFTLFTVCNSNCNFQTGLRVTAALEPSVINEIMDIVNSFRASIRMFNVSENERHGTYEITMKIAVPSNLELDKVISMIRNLRNVIKINRI